MYRDYQNKVHCYQLLDKAITTFYTNLALVKSTQEQHKCESCWKDGVGMGDGAGEWRRGGGLGLVCAGGWVVGRGVGRRGGGGRRGKGMASCSTLTETAHGERSGYCPSLHNPASPLLPSLLLLFPALLFLSLPLFRFLRFARSIHAKHRARNRASPSLAN